MKYLIYIMLLFSINSTIKANNLDSIKDAISINLLDRVNLPSVEYKRLLNPDSALEIFRGKYR